jgi:hypothetical protein
MWGIITSIISSVEFTMQLALLWQGGYSAGKRCKIIMIRISSLKSKSWRLTGTLIAKILSSLANCSALKPFQIYENFFIDKGDNMNLGL